MTTPKIPTMKKDGTRFYVPADTGEKYPGVTSILDVLPKPALKYWAERMVAERAVDELQSWIGMVIRGDRDEAIKYVKGAPYARKAGEAARKGTDLHDLFERMALGGKVLKRDVHPDLWADVVQFKDFLKVVEPEFHEMEVTVFSESPRYAGSFDALATVNAPQADGSMGRLKVMLDYKTGKGVYPETALQLTAYATADYILRPDGVRDPIPEVDGGAVLHVRPDFWALIPMAITEETRMVFEAACQIMEWKSDISGRVQGKKIQF